MSLNLRDIRQEYSKQELSFEMLASNPFDEFRKWFELALSDPNPEPTAFTLSTVNQQFEPDSRIVLLKELVDDKFLFFTNYNSKKGQDLEINPNVSALFFWSKSEKQVRIRGKIEKCPDSVSDEYFYSRPVASRAGAIASNQSQVIDISKDSLILKFEQTKQSEKLERPKHWGGYYIIATEIEFWQGGIHRLHDRFRYKKMENIWKIERLAP